MDGGFGASLFCYWCEGLESHDFTPLAQIYASCQSSVSELQALISDNPERGEELRQLHQDVMQVASDLDTDLLGIKVDASVPAMGKTESSDGESVHSAGEPDPLSFLTFDDSDKPAFANFNTLHRPKKGGQGRQGKPQLCSNCRQPGHKRRTCPSILRKTIKKESMEASTAMPMTPHSIFF